MQESTAIQCMLIHQTCNFISQHLYGEVINRWSISTGIYTRTNTMFVTTARPLIISSIFIQSKSLINQFRIFSVSQSLNAHLSSSKCLFNQRIFSSSKPSTSKIHYQCYSITCWFFTGLSSPWSIYWFRHIRTSDAFTVYINACITISVEINQNRSHYEWVCICWWFNIDWIKQVAFKILPNLWLMQWPSFWSRLDQLLSHPTVNDLTPKHSIEIKKLIQTLHLLDQTILSIKNLVNEFKNHGLKVGGWMTNFCLSLKI